MYVNLFYSLKKDIIYDPEVVICLVSVLKKLLVATTDGTRKTSSVVYLGSTIRNPETYHQFKMELGMWLVITQVAIVQILPITISIRDPSDTGLGLHFMCPHLLPKITIFSDLARTTIMKQNTNQAILFCQNEQSIQMFCIQNHIIYIPISCPLLQYY